MERTSITEHLTDKDVHVVELETSCGSTESAIFDRAMQRKPINMGPDVGGSRATVAKNESRTSLIYTVSCS